MGKDRSNPAPPGKSVGFASTSGIFKKLGTNPKSKDGRQHNVEESRQKIEQGTNARLDNVRDALITQTLSSISEVRDRKQKVDNSCKDLERPIDDELLELTRKDGTAVTMTLGKRMDAYRKLLKRENQNLNGLFEQWQEVSKEISSLITDLFGPEAAESILKGGTHTELPEFDSAEHRALMAEIQAEKEKAQAAAVAIGAKAVKLMKTGEKANSTLWNLRRWLIG
ncbi:MAG: hypothetical protein LQ337_001271 [Flavoplaca oasis]|nr:MAG: hypothetical protein LQ337_001271 [Flavoplaca oasis]